MPSVEMAIGSKEVVSRCRELGIKGPAAFARRFGMRIQDLSEQRALALLNGEKEPFERTVNIYDPTTITDEENDAWRAAWQAGACGKEQHGLGSTAPGDDTGRVHQATDEADRGDRRGERKKSNAPVFGQPYNG